MRRKGGIFSVDRGSSNWVLVSFIGFLCTCWITFRIGYLWVARPSGWLYILSLSTFEFSGRLSLFPFSLILSLSCCAASSMSSSMIFGPTLYLTGMFGGVTLCLSCVLLSEDFFAAELMMSDIFCNPEKIDKYVYIGLFVANVLRLSPRDFSASCTTSSCVGGPGRSYVYFCSRKNTTVSDIRYVPVVGIHPV